jgi:hypothetical protein
LPAQEAGHAEGTELTGEELRALFKTTLDPNLIRELVDEYGVQHRDRKLFVVELVIALILTGGTHEGGRQYDVMRTYLENTSTKVERSAFYSWFNDPLERLLTVLLARAIEAGQRQTKLLPGILSGVTDWRIIDATTVRLRGELFDVYPGAGDYAALKIHKEWSVGTGNLYAYKITPAREHDSPHLVVDETRRGSGIIADLAYVSLKRLDDCERHDVRYVVRLKENWKPTIDRLVRGAGFPEMAAGGDFDALLEDDVILLGGGHAIDADVTLGRGALRVKSRLVGIATPKGYCFFLTNLPRRTHGPNQVGDIYRVRWEIEIDNKVDKAGARLDEIEARKPVSVRILLLASMLNATLAKTIIQSESLAIVAEKKSPADPAGRGPLHPISLIRLMASAQPTVVRLLLSDEEELFEWVRLMARFRNYAADTSWRRRPSVLDIIQGLTAPMLMPPSKKPTAKKTGPRTS